MKKKQLNLKSITTIFSFLALFAVMGVFLHSCTQDPEDKTVMNEELMTEAELIAFIETIEKEKPRSTGEIDTKDLNQQQKDVILASQPRYGNCDPSIPSGPQTTDASATITVANNFFTAVVDYDYRYLSNNGGVTITDMTVVSTSGFWGTFFLLVDDPNLSPYSSVFNLYRGYMHAFIASAIEDHVVAQTGVVTYGQGFIFFGVDNKLKHKCWDASGTGSCSSPSFVTCCQRMGYYWSPTGNTGSIDRYYDSNGYAFIQGGSSSIVCPGSGNACGPASVQCDNISTGFNSHQ